MLGGLRQNLVCTRIQRPHKRLGSLALSVWVSPAEARVSSGLLQGQGLWLQQTWEVWCVSPTTEPLSRQPTNWRTIVPKKFSHCCESSRACNRFPNLEIWKRDWEPQGIWPWRPVGFDYRTYRGLGKQTLGKHKQNLVCTGTQEKGAMTLLETEPHLPVSIQESRAEVNTDLPWGQGHWIQQCLHKSFWRRLLP